jgi:lipopolysaccharide export system protein LptA
MNKISRLSLSLFIALLTISFVVNALESDKKADFILESDHFKNLPKVNNGITKMKSWGNVFIEQGTLKIHADEATIYNDKKGISKVVLTGTPVKMEQFIDAEYGKINVTANTIIFLVLEDKLLMSKNVVIKSKVQGEMTGEKISMNLKTKEIEGSKSDNKRVRLVIKPNS